MTYKIATIATTIALALANVSAPVMAASPVSVFASEPPEVAILTGCKDAVDKNGEKTGEARIMCILNLAVDILSIGVGIFGVIGISVAGIQYLTAGGSEEQTRKAKRRLFEIVIGLAAYVVIYTLLRWLLPSLR